MSSGVSWDGWGELVQRVAAADEPAQDAQPAFVAQRAGEADQAVGRCVRIIGRPAAETADPDEQRAVALAEDIPRAKEPRWEDLDLFQAGRGHHVGAVRRLEQESVLRQLA